MWENKEFKKAFKEFKKLNPTFYIKGKGYNFINQEGKFTWEYFKCFDKVYNYSDGFIKVESASKYNFIKKDGKLLWEDDIFNMWFQDAGYFENGFARVRYDGIWYRLNAKCELTTELNPFYYNHRYNPDANSTWIVDNI